jgi:type II secretory pathway pseudopilin PulG
MTSSYEVAEAKEKRLYAQWIVSGIIVLVLVIIGLMMGLPTYNVYQQKMRGRAAFAEAEQNRRIQIEEAKSNLEAQKLNSQAEVERAKGMAEAIEIENGKLTDKYIQYLWVRNMENNTNEKIYIPTEANLPLLEARSKQ